MLFAFITSGCTTERTFETGKLGGAGEAQNEMEIAKAITNESFFS